MIFKAFVKVKEKEMKFNYPEKLKGMTGSIFSSAFDLNNLNVITGGISAGSIGVDFYENGTKKVSAVIQVRSDIKPDSLDIDCFTRDFFSDGETEPPNSVSRYTEAKFHNIPREELDNGLIIGFRNSGSEVSQKITKEELDKLFKI